MKLSELISKVYCWRYYFSYASNFFIKICLLHYYYLICLIIFFLFIRITIDPWRSLGDFNVISSYTLIQMYKIVHYVIFFRYYNWTIFRIFYFKFIFLFNRNGLLHMTTLINEPKHLETRMMTWQLSYLTYST